jgi:hypothetical protein
MQLASKLLHPFQFIGHFGKSRFINFAIHVDIYIYVHSKIYVRQNDLRFGTKRVANMELPEKIDNQTHYQYLAHKLFLLIGMCPIAHSLNGDRLPRSSQAAAHACGKYC